MKGTIFDQHHHHYHHHRRSSRSRCRFLLLVVVVLLVRVRVTCGWTVPRMMMPTTNDSTVVQQQPFPTHALEYDHYNGVTLHLDQLRLSTTSSTTSGAEQDPPSSSSCSLSRQDEEQFERDLATALILWKAEGRKGIWIHCPHPYASLIPICTAHGFQFHLVKAPHPHHPSQEDTKEEDAAAKEGASTSSTTSNSSSSKKNMLILSQWLPTDSLSRLPLGPTHQIGVGIVLFHPHDPSRLLCVQEKTGPAAVHQIWKMPTGLVDPNEDLPEAASRELQEETGLDAVFQGIVCFKQAHSPRRGSSDLFFVCHMALTPQESDNDKDNKDKDNHIAWTPQEEEIADIQWMSVDEYCQQNLWQGSPLYETLNESIRTLSSRLVVQRQQQLQGENDETMTTTNQSLLLIPHQQLPVGWGGTKATNILFQSPSLL
jgi:ADP-ribose pyrophosphatase YjhB (NUDIX family)